MSQLSLSKELVDAIVRYLAARPYAEVANILEQMQREVTPQLAPQQPNLAEVTPLPQDKAPEVKNVKAAKAPKA